MTLPVDEGCPVVDLVVETPKDDEEVPEVVAVGRLAKSAVLEKVWQLEDEGTRTLYG